MKKVKLVKRKHKSIPLVKDKPVPYNTAIKRLKLCGMIREDWEIHQNRCNNDPIYRILYFGNNRLQMSDGSTPRYIDHLLGSALEILEKRLGKPFSESRWIKHVLPMLTDVTNDDIVPKIFAIFFILQKDWRIADELANLYESDENVDVFAIGGSNQFYAFIKYIKTHMEYHLNHSTNKYTVTRELKAFVDNAKIEYMLGPRPPHKLQ
jgi:hypothetical protein